MLSNLGFRRKREVFCMSPRRERGTRSTRKLEKPSAPFATEVRVTAEFSRLIVRDKEALQEVMELRLSLSLNYLKKTRTKIRV